MVSEGNSYSDIPIGFGKLIDENEFPYRRMQTGHG